MKRNENTERKKERKNDCKREKKERKNYHENQFDLVPLSRVLAGAYNPQSMRNAHHCASTYKAA